MPQTEKKAFRGSQKTAMFEKMHRRLAGLLIKDSDNTDNKLVRIRYGVVAGWMGIYAAALLFIVQVILGVISKSTSVIAVAFHLISDLVSSVVLVVSFRITARPATAKNPFGHGRMEHVAPLIISIFLFVSGLQIGEKSLHQALDPHQLHYWDSVSWVLLFSILIKQWLAGFTRFLGERVSSHAILAISAHHNTEAVMTLTVIGGLAASHYFHHAEFDGYVGILVSASLLYLGYDHGRKAIVPILGKAPSKDIIGKIRKTAKSVEGIEDVHEIIVNDYGSLYLISLHVEVPEKLGPAEMHEICERAERKLREVFGGEAVCHTDPLLEKTPEIQKLEEKFRTILKEFAQIVSYHDFRVIAESREKIIVVADIDAREDVSEEQFGQIAKHLEARLMEEITNIAYCAFYITPRFAY
jgi:cation diffusion facilitator family transporter